MENESMTLALASWNKVYPQRDYELEEFIEDQKVCRDFMWAQELKNKQDRARVTTGHSRWYNEGE
jgi:hypothetical protein